VKSAAFGVIVLLAACAAQQETGGVTVKRVESRDELCGGPVQYADQGDFLLQNSRIRAVVLDAGHGASPALWGGALADVDLVRPQAEFQGGKGLDQFFLILPTVNLNAPNPENGWVTSWRSPDGKTGVVRVVGRGDRVLAVLNLMDKVKELPAQVEGMLGMDLPTIQQLLKALFDVDLDLKAALDIKTQVLTSTDYILEEGDSFVRIVTTFRAVSDEVCSEDGDVDGDGLAGCEDPDCSLDPTCPDWCQGVKCDGESRCDAFFGGCFKPCPADGSCPQGECDAVTGLCVPRIREMKPLAAGTSLLDLLSGGTLDLVGGLVGVDMAKVLETLGPMLKEIKEKPGFAAGDMALLGANATTFVPGIGFELETQYRLMFLRGKNALLEPLAFDVMAGLADRVSYGYFSKDGEILFPFSTESLTASMTHGLNCLHAADDDADCDDLALARYTRYLAVGEGDVASVYDVIYQVRGTPHGRVRGHVLDARTFKPLSGADVFAIQDPCDPERCTEVVEGCGQFASYEALEHAARACSATAELPDGRGMVATQFRTDRGMDKTPDGSFEGPLLPGTWYLVARGPGRMLSVPLRVDMTAGGQEDVALPVPVPGSMVFRILDEKGEPLAARVTVGHCFPECARRQDCAETEICDTAFQCRPRDGCSSDAGCDPDEVCRNGVCVCNPGRLAGDFFEELGDGYMSDRKVAVELAPTGSGEVLLPPGRYDVVFSHGIEHSIDAREVELVEGVKRFVDARVVRQVDSTGWIGMDQHVHGSGSPDAAVSNGKRLDSALCDGLEVMITTDHDYIKTLQPTIRKLGLWQSVASWSGTEMSTLDVSHLIAWPLKYTEKLSAHGALEWEGMTADSIFRWARERGALSPAETVVTLAHPRGGMTSYFDVFNLNSFTLEPQPGTMQQQSPLLAPENLSPAWDVQEIANSKRFDVQRMPSIAEVVEYNRVLRQTLDGQALKSKQEILGELIPASGNVVRSMLVRTPEEQGDHWSFPGAPRCVLCNDDKGCPTEPLHQCRLTPGQPGVCMVPCGEEAGCPGSLACINGWCGDPASLPCDAIRGLTDEWLRLLSFGVFKPGVGGSDAHGIANFEIGCVRNYVRSPTDDPVAVTLPALAREILAGRSYVSYGPIVDFAIDGKGPGETASLAGRKSVKMKLRVQSADWFDVSRVEVLRNGVLEYVFDAHAEDPSFRIEVPNTGIVNVDAQLDAAPDEDSWYVVFAMGVEGRTMAPVYGSLELPPVYLGDLFQSVFGSLPIALPSYMTFPKIPVYYPQFPFAMTNPVFLDVDGKDSDGCLVSPTAGPPPAWVCNYPEDFPKERIPCICH